MEQSEFETLKPSQAPFTFPPHHRRPLKSKTYCTLFRILSHCYDKSQCSHTNQAVPRDPKRGNGLKELGEATEHQLRHALIGPACLESKSLLIGRDIESSEVFGFHDRGFNQDHMEVDEPDNVNKIEENEKLMNNTANNIANSLEEGNLSGDLVALANNQEDLQKVHMHELGNVGQLENEKYNLENSLEEGNPSVDVVELINNQEDQFSLQEVHTQELGNVRQLEKEKYNLRVTEALDSSLDIKKIADSAILHENNEERSSSVMRNASEEFEHEMQQKDMELEKSVSNCAVMNSHICVSADGELEEGEISWDFGVYDQSLDLLLEDAVSSEAKTVDGEQASKDITDKEKFGCKEQKEISWDFGVYDQSLDLLLEDAVSSEAKMVDWVQTSKDITDKEKFSCEEQKGTNEKGTKSNTKCSDVINNAGNDVEVEPVRSNRIEMKYTSKFIVHGKTIEAISESGYDNVLETGRHKKQGSTAKSDLTVACLENQLPSGKISRETATEKQGAMSTEKDASLRKKKMKVPPTKESREKKKKKKRIKRAEKNRKLGVKRLKLQPVLKPKAVTYCRHYLKGRCQEGENCKFSHDIIPLTKSKPCCHFARQSCMKGDDCPFDHQLSKYPCNNYVSKGSCSRGIDCMFSHEMPLEEVSLVDSNVPKPESMSAFQLGNSNSRKEVKNRGTPLQTFDAKSCSIGISPSKNTEQNVAASILKPAAQIPKIINPNAAVSTPKPAAQVPKGINFLSFGRSTPGETSKCKQAGSSLKADDDVKAGHQMIHSGSNLVGNSNEITKRTAGVAPRGINFLSFCRAPLDDSSNKKSGGLPSHNEYGIGKSLLGDSIKDKLVGSSPRRDDGVKVGSQTSRSALDVVQNLNVMPKRIPAVAFPGINSLSFGKAPSDDSSNNRQASLPSTGDNGVASLNTSNSAQKALLSKTSSSAQKALLANTSSSVQKALLSTLAFAASCESGIKVDRSTCSPAVSIDIDKGNASSKINPRER